MRVIRLALTVAARSQVPSGVDRFDGEHRESAKLLGLSGDQSCPIHTLVAGGARSFSSFAPCQIHDADPWAVSWKLSREYVESADVGGTDDREMSAVECSNLHRPETLRYRNYRGIDRPER